MTTPRRNRPINTSRQRGMTLMETMISLALSVVVTGAMVALMANSLGTASRIIQMSVLTDELRNAMSMMTRDVRRANYSAHAAYCFANSDCGVDGSANQVGDITVADNSCFTFNLDRNQDGDATTDDAGGFRLNTVGAIGVIEVWVGDAAPDCDADSAQWLAVTDPDVVDVTEFIVDDARSFTGELAGEASTVMTQRTRKIGLRLEGRLIRENAIARNIEDIINVRNDVITVAPAA